jgi:hypothetical protein
MKIRFAMIGLLLLVLVAPISSANAAWVSYQSSPNDRFNAADVKPEYDVVSIDIGISDETPNEIYFFLEFSQRITNSQFADGKGSWAAVMLDMDNDGKADFSMDTSSQSYTNNFYHTAKFTNRQGVVPMADSRCMAITWTNLVNDAKWIAFRIQKTCLNFTGTFGVRGYADFDSSDNATSDWGPDEFWKVSLADGVISTPTPTPTATATTNTVAIALINAKNAASDATNAAEEAIAAFSEAKSDCEEISNSFDDSEVIDLYDSTSLDEYCNQLDLEAASVERKISALDPQEARTVDAANRETDTANKLAEAADILVAGMQDITDELSATESLLSDLLEVTNFFNDFESSSIEQIDMVKERIGMLPATLQSTLKKSNDFKALTTFQRQVEAVLKSKDSILDVFAGIKRPSQITPSINSMNSLKSQLPSLNTLKKNLQSLDKKIPAVVCQKGSLVVSASKTGKCAKGFESTPTR